MSARLRALTIAFAALLTAVSAVSAQSPSTAPGVLRLLPADSVTEKTITAGNRPLAYTATAGTLALYDQPGERSAAIFYPA